MQTVPAGFLQAVASGASPVVVVDAWYNGSLVAGGLQVIAGAVTQDATRATVGSATLTLGSPDGSLIPTSYSSPLACYGSELHIRAGLNLAGQQVLLSLGWFRIDDFECSEWWQAYPQANGQVSWASRGTKVDVNCSDRSAALEDAQFIAPAQPASLTSAITEIQRLCSGIVPLADLSAVTDAAIPSSMTYGSSRIQAVQDLASLLGMQAVMNQDGALSLVPVTFLNPDGVMPEVLPSTTSTPVWTVGVTEAAPIHAFKRKGSRSGLYNAAVSTGVTSAGVPVSGQALLTSGPLAFGGPFGQVPFGHDSILLTSIAACTTDAQNVLAFLGDAQAMLVPATLPWNPALQLLDTVTVTLPNGSLTGPVQSIRWPLTPGPMEITLAIPRDSLWTV